MSVQNIKLVRKFQLGGTSDWRSGILKKKTLRVVGSPDVSTDLIGKPQAPLTHSTLRQPELLFNNMQPTLPSSSTGLFGANKGFGSNPKVRGNTASNAIGAATGATSGATDALSGAAKSMKGVDTANAVGASIGAVTNLAGEAIASFAKPGETNTWGITQNNYKADAAATTLKTAGKWAATGASIGSMFPGIGTAIGAGVGLLGGAIAGLLKSKKDTKANKSLYADSTQQAYEGYNQKANAQQYAMMGKCGAKLAFHRKMKGSKKNAISYKTRKFKVGGRLEKLGEVNIIPAGTLHKENNNLGNKDKGIPIIDKDGNKIFEVEREELILRLKTTKDVENHIDRYKKSNNERHLIDLGKLLSKEIMTNTHDFSGKFGMEAK